METYGGAASVSGYDKSYGQQRDDESDDADVFHERHDQAYRCGCKFFKYYNLSTVTLTTYSTGLLGKEVTIAIPDPNGEKDKDGKVKVTYKKGTVTGVDLTGATAVYVDGKKYELSQVMSVGDVPEELKDDETSEDGETSEGEEVPGDSK